MIGVPLAVLALVALAATLFSQGVHADDVARASLAVLGCLGCLALAGVVIILGTR